jgi:hypothetical protein
VEQERAVAEWRREEATKLLDRLPDWKDQAKATADQKLIVEYLISQGYTAQELSDLHEHRSLLVARDAALWRQHQAALKTAKDKQVKQEPGKPLKPGAAQNTQPQATQAYRDALSRARKTGKEDDVMALLAAKRAK